MPERKERNPRKDTGQEGYMEPLLEKWNLWRENGSTVAPTPHMVVVVVVVVV